VTDITESIHVTMRPRTWQHLQKKLQELKAELENDFEEDYVIAEVVDLELNIEARLQRIAKGDLQT
jgi:hypothetical protein